MNEQKKFPLGIDFLDRQIGGVYPGLIILHEMVGAGGKEFAITSLLNNSSADVPSEILYLSVTQDEKEVIRGIKLAFPEAHHEKLLKRLRIESLAEAYFEDSIVPLRWIGGKLSIEKLRGKKRNILSEFGGIIEECQEGSLIFLDSLTDLTRLAKKRIRWEDLIDMVKGVKKLCIEKNLLLMALLTANVVEKEREEELLDQADGVLVFEWEVEKESVKRWLYFRKFLGVLPFLERERVVKYDVRIDPALGFTISRIMRVV